jgi:transcriptional regulator with XRE-family HTH domain
MDDLLGERTLGDAIKAYRFRQQMSQNELALKSGIKKQHITEIEHGEKKNWCCNCKEACECFELQLQIFIIAFFFYDLRSQIATSSCSALRPNPGPFLWKLKRCC